MFFACSYGAALDTAEAQLNEELALAKQFGWTLDYVRSLDELEYTRILAHLDGQSNARQVAQWRASLPPLGR